MCLGNSPKEQKKKSGHGTSSGHSPHDYSHIFNELETHLIIHRALLMQRLVQDPFYRVMNVSSAARLWMLRHLKHIADHAEHRYQLNLLQFFEMMGREDILRFLRYKNAPKEIIVLWDQMHPVTPQNDKKQRTTFKRRI